MSGMFERTLFKILAAGREEATENSAFLVDFFCSLGLSQAEAEGIRAYWDGVKAPNLEEPTSPPFRGVDIIHQFPRGPNPVFPCWAIVLVNEQEGGERTDRFLGDEVDDFDPEGNFTGLATGSIWDSTYGVYTYAPESADLCIYYYELARFFLSRARPVFKKAGMGAVLDSHFSGADMMPDPRYDPAHLFVRRFTVKVRRSQTVLAAADLARGNRITGAFLGPNPESQVTGVDPGVTVAED